MNASHTPSTSVKESSYLDLNSSPPYLYHQWVNLYRLYVDFIVVLFSFSINCYVNYIYLTGLLSPCLFPGLYWMWLVSHYLCCKNLIDPYSYYLLTNGGVLTMRMPAGNRLLPNFGHCLVEYKNMRFLIMDRPSKANIGQFVEVCSFCLLFIRISYWWLVLCHMH